MASAGPSDARTHPAWRSSAARAGEDAAARSVPAAASGVLGRVEGTPGSHGNTSAARLQHVLNHLRPGRYTLHVAGQRGGGTQIVVG